LAFTIRIYHDAWSSEWGGYGGGKHYFSLAQLLPTNQDETI